MTGQEMFSLRDLIDHKIRLYFNLNSCYGDDDFASRYRIKIYKKSISCCPPKYRIRVVNVENNFNYEIKISDFVDPSWNDILAVSNIIAGQFASMFETHLIRDGIAKTEKICMWVGEENENT